MANFSIKYGFQDNLASTAFVAGQVLVTTDTRAIYIDKPNGTTVADRIRIGDFQVVDCIDANDSEYSAGKTILPVKGSASTLEAAVGTQLFFVKSKSALAVAKGDAWIQINTDTDTGATAVAFSGGSGTNGAPAAGEVIIGSSYDSATRTITFIVGTLSASQISRGSNSTVDADITALETSVNTLKGDDTTSGSVAKAVKDAVEGLDASEFALASVSDNVVTIKGIKEADGVIAVGDGAGISLEEVAYTGAAADVSVADTGSNFTGSTVEAVLAEIATSISNANNAGKVTVESGSDSSYAAVYNFYQGVLAGDDASAKEAKKIGTINIPKDMVISAGEVKAVTTADTPYTGAVVGDKYIDLTIANNDGTHIYIPVKDLVDVYTGSIGAEVTVTVSGTNVIGATINKVSASKIITREAADAQGDPGDPDYVPAVTEQNLTQKLAEMAQAQTTAIQALDADLDASGTAQNSGTFVVSGVTEVDGVITAVDSVEVEAAGAAATAKSEVIGANTDLSSADTIYGAKKYADEAVQAGMAWGTF